MLINKEYVTQNKEEILSAIKSGKIFIYPTDTIYGLGCNAEVDDSVKKIREIKERDSKPFSVIVPSKVWALDKCDVKQEDLDKYLPGRYTLFVKKKEKESVSKEVNPGGDTLGIRIPEHWFTQIVSEAGVPFVTTSVNISGENHMTKIEDVPEEILKQVDYVIYEGEIDREPSTKVNLVL